jgi:hypothetical protein
MAFNKRFVAISDSRCFKSLLGKEVPTSHSHRGFSPVIETAQPSRVTVSTVFFAGEVATSVQVLGPIFQPKQTVKTVELFIRALITGLKPRCE